nr:hypothetical protein [Breoghania sp.]
MFQPAGKNIDLITDLLACGGAFRQMGIVKISERHVGPAIVSTSVVVVCQFLAQDRKRPAIRHQMVHGKQKNMFVFSKTK